MRCRGCRQGDAVIELARHRTALCGDCFVAHSRDRVARTVAQFRMIREGERPLVAVSGGKDSLAVWDILLDLGYQADGVYLGLGIGDYSDASLEHARAYADRRRLRLHVVDVSERVGAGIPEAAQRVRRSTCGTCGLSKRHLLNGVALEHGYPVLVTGHNLDDEAAVLFGNVLDWKLDYLARQRPVLPETEGFARRVKPLVRLSEYETAAYCVVRGIDYQVDECPIAHGNKHLGYKEALDAVEERQPGAKHHFYAGFLNRVLPLLEETAAEDRAGVRPCSRCGSPTTGEVCAMCRLRDQVERGPQPPRRRRRPAAGRASGRDRQAS